MPRRWNARASCSASPCPDSSGGATLGATEAAEAGLVLDVAAATATRYAALDPGLVADVKRTVAMGAGGAFDAVLDFEAWAPASSVTKPAVAAAIGAAPNRS